MSVNKTNLTLSIAMMLPLLILIGIVLWSGFTAPPVVVTPVPVVEAPVVEEPVVMPEVIVTPVVAPTVVKKKVKAPPVVKPVPKHKSGTSAWEANKNKQYSSNRHKPRHKQIQSDPNITAIWTEYAKAYKSYSGEEVSYL